MIKIEEILLGGGAVLKPTNPKQPFIQIQPWTLHMKTRGT